MRAIIIGTPGKGKTHLANMLSEKTGCNTIVSLGKIRDAIGIHEPHKGYEIEVSPKNVQLLTQVLDNCLNFHMNWIVEGYGLAPSDALRLAEQFSCPCVLLCHKHTTAEEDYELMRKYDDKEKWSQHRPDAYMRSLYKFYKGVEQVWIKEMPKKQVFSTDRNFDASIKKALNYLITRQI